MSSREVALSVGPGLVQLRVEGQTHWYAATLRASEEDRLGRELMRAAAELRANPKFETLPEDER